MTAELPPALGIYAPPAGDPLAGRRTERVRVELLDDQDRLRGTLGGVQVGGTVELNVNRPIRGGGNLVLTRELNADPWPMPDGELLLDLADVDWFRDRIRIWWEVQDGPTWPLGTFIISSPSDQYQDGWVSKPVELLDKLAVLQQDAVPRSYSLEAGTVVTAAIANLILEAGETAMAITDSEATLPNGAVWPPGTPRLSIINDLLDSINYFSLWTDGMSRYRAAPYVRPDARPPSYQFRQGDLAIHSPEWQREQDLYSVPNRVVLVTQGSAEEEALVSVYPESEEESDALLGPLGYTGRGRWITMTEEGVEAVSQEALDSLARQRLLDQVSPVANLQVQHQAVPLNLNDTVRFASSGYESLAVVQSMTYTLEAGAMVTASWREVVAP